MHNLSYYPSMYFGLFLFIALFAITNEGQQTLVRVIKERKFLFISRNEQAKIAAEAANPDNVKEKQTSYTRK